MKTERIEVRATAECFQAHRQLWEAAADVARRLKTTTEEGHALHLGASCMRLAAEQAFQARDGVHALRSWRECILADRQIKIGTYFALRNGTLDAASYDLLFGLASQAAKIREEERQRIRRQLINSYIA
jgi:hypothetical protein